MGGAEYATFSSTGLTLTGGLSATGTISTSAGQLITTTAGAGLGSMTGGTNAYFDWSDGTTTSRLQMSGGILYFGTAAGGGTVYLRVNSSTIASLTSAGLAVTGTISGTNRFVSNGGTAGGNGIFDAMFNGNTAQGLDVADSANASGAAFCQFRNSASSVIGSITRVTTTNAIQVNLSSDRRLKHNVRDFTDSGSLIDGLRPVCFDWNGDETNDDLKNAIGFIAQETHASSPIFAHIGAVSVGDEDPETITKQWQRSDAALIPILVAELKALRQRVAALESK
jgi:hypothetical protein